MSEQGSNSTITADHRRARSYHHKGVIQALLKKEAKAKAAVKSAKKLAEGEGIPWSTVQDLIALGTPEGEARIRAELQRRITVFSWEDFDSGTQFSFDDIPNRAPLTERAFEEGKRAGMEATDRKSPYDVPDASNAWLDGYTAGQTLLMESQELFTKAKDEIKSADVAKAEAKAARQKERDDKKAEKTAKAAEPKRPRGRPSTKGRKAKANGAERPADPDQTEGEHAGDEQPQEAAE